MLNVCDTVRELREEIGKFTQSCDRYVSSIKILVFKSQEYTCKAKIKKKMFVYDCMLAKIRVARSEIFEFFFLSFYFPFVIK